MSVDVLFEQAWDVAPFSDAAAGDVWMGNWCGRCVKDRAVRVGEGPGCPLVLVALMGRTPAPWLLPEVGGEFHCLEFRGEDDGPGPEPRPVPDPPGQLCLFPRDGFEGVRMFAQACAEPVAAGTVVG